MIKTLNAEEWDLNSLDLPIDFNVLGDVDEDGNPAILTQIEAQLTEFQARVDAGEFDTKFEIKVRPVIDMEGFGDELQLLNAFMGGAMPLNMSASVNLGDQKIVIDDTNIIAEIRSVRNELVAASSALQNVLYAVNGSLSSDIYGAGSMVAEAVSRIKLNQTPMSLQSIDQGLYQSARNSALTGVSTYNNNPNISVSPN